MRREKGWLLDRVLRRCFFYPTRLALRPVAGRAACEHIPAPRAACWSCQPRLAPRPDVTGLIVTGPGRCRGSWPRTACSSVPVLGRLLRGAGQIPVYRGTADAQRSLARRRAGAATTGKVVVIYPEGTVTRDPDLWPMQARTGVARLALTTDVAVLPVAQWGPQRVYDGYQQEVPPAAAQPIVDPLAGRRSTSPPTAAGRDRRGPAARGDRPDHGRGPRPAGRGARRARAAPVLPRAPAH